MKFEIIPVTHYLQNCTLIWCENSGSAALIDPGGDVDSLLDEVSSRNLKLEKILLTHGHLDHAGGAAEIRRRTGVPIHGPHIDDKFLMDSLDLQGKTMGIPGGEVTEPDFWHQDGDVIEVGSISLDVLLTPGHTPGHISLYSEPDSMIWVGDVLFKGSIGRTDFPRGDHQQLVNTCKEILFKLPETVRFYPGHGPSSTIGYEMRTNPFVGENV